MLCRRFTPLLLSGLQLQKRAAAEGEPDMPPLIRGTAAVFFDEKRAEQTQYQLWRDTWERIQPTAFNEIADDDVRALQNHDPRLLLGRSVAGTLGLSVDAVGLHYEIDTANTTAGRDTVISLERGDMTGSSFAFSPVRTTWTEIEDENGYRYFRNIELVRTFDVGPVTYPAYLGTSSGASGRSAGCALSGLNTRDAESEVANLRGELDQYLREHYHAPQRRRRERVLAMLG